MKLWGGRFNQPIGQDAWELNKSIAFDQRMAPQDVRGSLAWAQALKSAGVLTLAEWELITGGLQTVLEEFENAAFVFTESDEDIHTAVERRLGELIGPLSGKLHTGRSRNDQVATDFRLWLLEHLPILDSAITNLQSVLIERAETHLGVILPGYTHLQRAQPISLSHWWLSHFWPLQRDRERLLELRNRTAILPLGCGALAGTPFPIDRNALAEELGFLSPAPNSLDAVSDRDFAVEFLFCTALIGVHLSKLAESVILYSSAEFGFFELSDAYTTGSSLMPQKKNPDVFELVRGKSGTLMGSLIGLLATMKALPSTYDKDLQEDKLPVFNGFDTLMSTLPVIANALQTLTIHPDRMKQCIDASMMATDLADYLVEKGVPFREAHALVGQAVQTAAQNHKGLDQLSASEYQAIHTAFENDVYAVFDPVESIARRSALGGTAPEAVKEQIQTAQLALQMRQ